MGNVTHHGAEGSPRDLGLQRSNSEEERNCSTLLYNSAYFAPIVEYASKARPLQGGKVVPQNFPAFWSEQIAKGLVRHFRNTITENRFSTGAERMNLAIAIKRNDAIRCRIKNARNSSSVTGGDLHAN